MLLESLRKEIANLGNKLLRQGLVHDGQGNLSAMDREQGLVAITPCAVSYEQRGPDDICVVDLDGDLIEGRWKPTSEIALHLIFYRRRDAVSAVVHTHPPYTSVFSVLQEETMPLVLSEAAMALGAAVRIAPYRRPGTQDIADITERACGPAAAVIMAHHGLVTTGSNLHLAHQATLAAEFTARVLIMARSMGASVNELDEAEVAELRRIYLDAYKSEPR
jgi:L-ribulose-5-phosphate 4-epimerase